MAGGKDGPVVTDNGQLVLDLRFPPGTCLREADHRLHAIPGVTETGLFFDLAVQAFVASSDAGRATVRTLSRAGG
jgi:ribose 5-phosphate isomerase A